MKKILIVFSLLAVLIVIVFYWGPSQFDFKSMDGQGKYAESKKIKYFSGIESQALGNPFLIVQEMDQVQNTASSYFEAKIWFKNDINYTIYLLDEHLGGSNCVSIAVNEKRIKCSITPNSREFYACTSFFIKDASIFEGDNFSLSSFVDQSDAVSAFFDDFPANRNIARQYNVPNNGVPIKKVHPTIPREEFEEPLECWLESLVQELPDKAPKEFVCNSNKYASCKASKSINVSYD